MSWSEVIQKKLNLFVNTFVVTFAIGCPAILIGWLWDTGKTAKEQMETISTNVNHNTDMLKSMKTHLVKGYAEIEAQWRTKDEERRAEIAALHKQVELLKKKASRADYKPTSVPAIKVDPLVISNLRKKHEERLKESIKKDYDKRTEERQMIQQRVPKGF
jgi:hypothetical protein